MKRLLVLITLGVGGYFAYMYFVKSGSVALPSVVSNRLPVNQVETQSSDAIKVLGAKTQNVFNKGKAVLNTATNGAAEPVINRAVSDLEKKVKDLPEEQYKKVKYEFCKDVFPSAEPTNQGGV